MKDTFIRSCEHWSETSRNEMENFYTLASIDYKRIAKRFEWKKWLEAHQINVGARKLKLLDIACGSGKFPSALLRKLQRASGAVEADAAPTGDRADVQGGDCDKASTSTSQA